MGTATMASKPVDVMVVNFNTAGLLQPMFDALRRADSERLASYLVVDNASRDDSVQRMAQVCPEALLLSNKQNVLSETQKRFQATLEPKDNLRNNP